jgi:hypothetical protein
MEVARWLNMDSITSEEKVTCENPEGPKSLTGAGEVLEGRWQRELAGTCQMRGQLCPGTDHLTASLQRL